MKLDVYLDVPDDLHSAIWTHLLASRNHKISEEACFGLAKMEHTNGLTTFKLFEWIPLGQTDFIQQSEYYLELSHESRAKVIKLAFDNNASLIEFHSHPSAYHATFSKSDVFGLREFVPHVWWRLKKRPYMAIVVSPFEFDALVWLKNPIIPVALNHINVSGQLMRPSNRTIDFEGDYYEK